ncbi:unnamed protein product [Microthlaspi erraticum]|uniref:Uncharacterized protein n=1 Tax=Microthlaspi erraticum TaxID=1685480 RepID=A0A6D2KHL7_9BRAS|nr:unnamed protein product [Microthlaspi erraticum]
MELEFQALLQGTCRFQVPAFLGLTIQGSSVGLLGAAHFELHDLLQTSSSSIDTSFLDKASTALFTNPGL